MKIEKLDCSRLRAATELRSTMNLSARKKTLVGALVLFTLVVLILMPIRSVDDGRGIVGNVRQSNGQGELTDSRSPVDRGILSNQVEAEMPRFQGTISIQDRVGGGRRLAGSGVLLVVSDTGFQKVPFVNGKWTLNVQGSIRVVGAREAGVEKYIRRTMSGLDQKGVELNAFGFSGFYLEAHQEDGSRIDEFRVFSVGVDVPRGEGPARTHPGNVVLWETIATTLTGEAYVPLASHLAPSHHEAEYWVSALDRSWARISLKSIDPEGSNRATLKPGGNLKVSVSDFEDLDELKMFVVDSNGNPYASFAPVYRKDFELDGMHLGAYTAFLSLESMNVDAVPVSNLVDFRVLDGMSASIRLNMERDETGGEMGAVHVSFLMDSEELWADSRAFAELALFVNKNEPSIAFEKIAPSRKFIKIADDDQFLKNGRVWDIGLLPTGKYRIRVEPLGYEVDLTVTRDELTVVEIVLPTVGRSLVEVHLSGGGNADGVIVYAPKMTAAQKSLRSMTADEQGVYELTTMPGEITITTYRPGHGMERFPLQIRPGWNYFDLTLGSD